MLDEHCREEKRRGAAVRNYIADAEKRIAAHVRRAPNRLPVLGEMYDGRVPNYKLVSEGYTDEYVRNDFQLHYLKPEHLMNCDE